MCWATAFIHIVPMSSAPFSLQGTRLGTAVKRRVKMDGTRITSFKRLCVLSSRRSRKQTHRQLAVRAARVTYTQKDRNVRLAKAGLLPDSSVPFAPTSFWFKLVTGFFGLDCARIGLQDESQMILKRELKFKDSRLRGDISMVPMVRDPMHFRHVEGISIDCPTGRYASCKAFCFERKWQLAARTHLDFSAIRAHSKGACEHSTGDGFAPRHSNERCSKLSFLNLWELLNSGPQCRGAATTPRFWPHYRRRLKPQRRLTHVISTDSTRSEKQLSSQVSLGHAFISSALGKIRTCRVLTVSWASSGEVS